MTNSSPLISLSQPTNKCRPARSWALGMSIGLVIFLSGCSNLQGLLKSTPATGGSHVISVGEELWTISFHPDGEITNDEQIVPGEVVIQRRGQVLQTIKHSLSRRAATGEDDSWLLVEDVNNDGLTDFLLTHASASAGTNPIKSLYLFDEKSRSFQLQKEISNLGDIDKLSGCVVVTASEKEGAAPRTYCFSSEQNGWMEIQHRSTHTAGRCNTKLRSVPECRVLRNQRDGEMRRQIREYIDIKSKAMIKENRKTDAQGFARNLRIGHDQWLRYRDARCASFVIEYNFPESAKTFELESCKLDLSSLQLRHYASMLASLEK